MSDERCDEKREEKVGPLKKYGGWAKLIGVVIGIAFSTYLGASANEKADDTQQKAKQVTNANASAIEKAILDLYLKMSHIEAKLGEKSKPVKIVASAPLLLPSKMLKTFRREESRKRAMRLRARRPRPMSAAPESPPKVMAEPTPEPVKTPDAGVKPDARKPPKPAPRPPVKFRLRRMNEMAQEQAQIQEEL